METNKTYLSKQIRLLSFSSNDFLTPDEQEIYENIIELKKKINELDKKDDSRSVLIENKKHLVAELEELIRSHAGKPREVCLKNVLVPKAVKRGDTYATWDTLKWSKRITEFMSAESRAMGMKENDVCYDKIIIKWRHLEILRQLVLYGYNFTYMEHGEIKTKHYHITTASSGQLRTDKVQSLSDEAWERIKDKTMCGLSEEIINSKGGINVNKYLAYTALSSGATDEWTDFDIDRCIVIPDWNSPVTAMMRFINPDYTFDVGERTVTLDQVDGVGMVLPGTPCFIQTNKMIRLPFFKGLMAVWDFIGLILEKGWDTTIVDLWGQKHDLIEEDIRIIFTESQFKMWKYYDDWDQYKYYFKKYGCTANITNYEEEYVEDTTMNYQFLQTLTDFTNEEIEKFTARAHAKIENMTKDKSYMLKTLHADENSALAYNQALCLYPELLRDGYSRETLKAIKKKMLNDAKSGKIKCENKRLFVIPDLYAACEYWFGHIENPEGMIPAWKVIAKPFNYVRYVDVLRSPHLYREHCICEVITSPEIAKWYTTNAIYVSSHDLLSRICQFDFDGDQLNVVGNKIIVDVAKRNLENDHIVPLFYDANKAAPEQLSRETLFNGLKRAHDFSGIGIVSNSLTRLWAKEKPDLDAAAWLTYFNNLVIDAAKTAKINSYEQYPEVCKRITKATGGNKARMPYWFQFSKNGRSKEVYDKHKNFAKDNDCVMNRFARRFNDIGHISLNYAGIPPFNYQMMLTEDIHDYNTSAIHKFRSLIDMTYDYLIVLGKQSTDTTDWMTERMQGQSSKIDIVVEIIQKELESEFGSLEEIYPSITKYLFSGDQLNKNFGKRMYWLLFGDIAVRNLKENLADYTECEYCKMKIPKWVEKHMCVKSVKGFYECIDCGVLCERTNSRQCRCSECQERFRKLTRRDNMRKYREKDGVA